MYLFEIYSDVTKMEHDIEMEIVLSHFQAYRPLFVCTTSFKSVQFGRD